MNAADLKIENVSVTIDAGILSKPFDTVYSPDTETISFLFDKPLSVSQNAFLDVEYTGQLNDKLRGFYRSKYLTSTGEERFGAVTQFAPIDARRCFPCWVRQSHPIS